MPITRGIATLVAAVVTIGCGSERDAGTARTEVATTKPVSAPVVIESPGALAMRREAQEMFDDARAALARKDFRGEHAALLSAADFMRAEAGNASGGARSALERAAEQLERLAERAGKGEPHSAGLLACAFVDAHGAEALHHLLRAKTAMGARDNVRAGEELAMSVDHLERAVKDAGRESDAAVQTGIADARSLAVEMMKGMVAMPDEERRVTEEIEHAVRRLIVHDQ